MIKKTSAVVVMAVLLIASISANVYLLNSQHKSIAALKTHINSLETENTYLIEELYRTNLSLQQARAQLQVYRDRIAKLTARINRTAVAGEVGSAQLEAPAVLRRVQYQGNYPFYRPVVTENGTMIRVSVDIKPGYGRVLVVTKPLMGVVFQDAANTATIVAENYTGIDLSGSDVTFSVEAPSKIPEVDGPSAGALMTILVIAALNNISLPPDITMTGTISSNGHVGEIGGVIEKAKAARESGKRIFILPRENSRLIQYKEVREQFGFLTIIRQTPIVEDAKEYIEKNIGIHVEYVDSIDDIMRLITA